MATYVIGDVHGSRRTLRKLLREISFRESEDRLWMVGDLVNRGSDSLGVLRWARELHGSMGERFVCVLGNHDLHLLACDAGLRTPSPDLQPVLKARDRGPLLDWLRQRPLLHRGVVNDRPVAVVHAGLWPSWTVDKAETWARRVSEAFGQPKRARRLLEDPKDLRGKSSELGRLASALYGFTVLRTLKLGERRTPCRHKGTLEDVPAGCVPWFDAPKRRWRGTRLIFGHWAALGLYRGDEATGLDSGCAWGGPLTALRLDDDRIFQVPRSAADASKDR